TDQTVQNADGSKTETVTYAHAGAPVAGYVETDSADGLSIDKSWDTNGDGTFDQTATDVTVVNADGTRTRTVIAMRGTSQMSRSVTTTSADGLTQTTRTDTDGNGSFDQTRTTVTAHNADGSSTQTVTDLNADLSLRDTEGTSTSADGHTVTVT